MKDGVAGEKKFERAESQVNLNGCLAFFLFLAESARHFGFFLKRTRQFVPAVIRIKGGGQDA